MKISIDEFLQRGLFAMTKKDYELMIFHELLSNDDFCRMSIYEKSLYLKTTPTKIKNIEAEVGLRYTSSLEIEKCAKAEFEELSKHVCIFEDGKSVKFIVESVNTRNYMESVLRSKYKFSDSSFNREVVVVSANDFIFLLGEFYGKTEEFESKLKKIERESILKEVLSTAVGTIGGKLAEKTFDVSINVIEKIINNVSKQK